MTISEIVKQEFNLLKNNHPIYRSPDWTVSPPYQNKRDLRRHVSIGQSTNAKIGKTSKSYPRFILECKLGRLLKDDEDSHHKNGLEFDDRLENLEVVERYAHRSEHKTKLPEYFICPICKTNFALEGQRLAKYKTRRKNINYPGPYCSKSCAGKGNFI